MRTELLNGNLPLPDRSGFVGHFGEKFTTILERMWRSLWHRYLANPHTCSTSTIYWLEELGQHNSSKFNEALDALLDVNAIIVETRDDFSSVALNPAFLVENKWCTLADLGNIRYNHKFDRYLPVADMSPPATKARVRINGKPSKFTATRKGMDLGAKSLFTYDRAMIAEHFDSIVKEANKGMYKVIDQYPDIMEDESNYANIVEDIIAHLANNEVVCNMQYNEVDSRYRAIKGGLKKVFNPIGFKVARCMIVIPEEHRKLATKAGMDAILLFIAELNGYKAGTIEGKKSFGTDCWLENKLPHELYEAIWCKRLYKELFEYQIATIEGKEYKWSVPIELDQGASVLQFIGLLLGDKQLLESTNVIVENGIISDPWSMYGNINRNKGKDVIMRRIYGSGLTVEKTLTACGHEFTAEELIDLEDALSHGGYGVANKFKEFIIANVTMSEFMHPVVNGEVRNVPCNRFHVHGEEPHFYDVLNAKGLVQEVVHWRTVKTPDLKSFKRWSVTGLVHGIDNQPLDNTMQKLDWGIDIHDAIVCGPEDAPVCRSCYQHELKYIFDNRETILNDYFKSMGIEMTPESMQQWEELMELVTPLDKPLEVNGMCLK